MDVFRKEPAAIRIEVVVPLDAPEGWRQQLLERARRDIGINLYEFLMRQVQPVVLRSEETIERREESFFDSSHPWPTFVPSHYRIIIEVWATAVQHEHVTIAHYEYAPQTGSTQPHKLSGWASFKETIRHLFLGDKNV